MILTVLSPVIEGLCRLANLTYPRDQRGEPYTKETTR